MNEKYIPLYRKYRPQKLDEVVGQEHIKKALKSAIEINKISHAYLFTGPRGTGKTSTARILAKSLNCKNGPTISPCGECESCVDILNSVPMDVVEIDAASNRKVEDTQNILEKILYAPVYGKYKIYIIDEVHMLSNTAFNSLLKTLEEPPENVIFILATTEVHKVLDTIKSRCQRFDFKRITVDDIVKHLDYIAKQEKINITEEALLLIAKNSAGGMRDSIALLDQVSVLGLKDAITVDDINNLLGRLSFDVLNSLSDKILSSDTKGAIEILENVYNSGNEPVQILSNLTDYLKDLLIVKNSHDNLILELTQLNEVQVKTLKEQVKNIETHQIIALLDKCSNYIKEIKLTNNPRLWLEVAIIDLANLAENTQLANLQKRLELLENGNFNANMHTPSYNTPPLPVSKPEVLRKTEPVKPVSDANANNENAKQIETNEEFSPMPKSKPVQRTATDDLNSLWVQLLENISSFSTKALLKQWARPVLITPESTVISINNETWLKQFVDGTKRAHLVQAVDKLFGQENSNLLVRLPLADDVQTELPKVVEKPKTVIPESSPEPEETVSEEEIESVQEMQNTNIKRHSTMHSENVNMAVDLFDGKIIE